MNRRTFCRVLAAAALPAGWSAGALADPTYTGTHLARAIYAGSPGWVHDRQPQPLLRAVVVLRIRLRGGTLRAEVLRHNPEQPAMLARARETVKRIKLSDLPPPLLQRLSRQGVIETWLFDSDGSFQVRTLARPQRSS